MKNLKWRKIVCFQNTDLFNEFGFIYVFINEKEKKEKKLNWKMKILLKLQMLVFFA